MSENNSAQFIKRAFEYKAAGNFKQAIDHLLKALEIEPENSEVLAEIAGLYVELSNPDKAIRYYEQALLYDPDNISVKFKLARVYKGFTFGSSSLRKGFELRIRCGIFKSFVFGKRL